MPFGVTSTYWPPYSPRWLRWLSRLGAKYFLPAKTDLRILVGSRVCKISCTESCYSTEANRRPGQIKIRLFEYSCTQGRVPRTWREAAPASSPKGS